jgi:protein required for attachment to host cells
MSTLTIRTGDWIVLCDGRKALFTVNAGDAEYLNLKVVEERESPSPATHEQGTDRPGRTHQSVGAARSSVGQTDWHDQGERDFLRTVAERINKAVQDREAKGLIIVAPPRALGVLKPLLSPATRGVLNGSLDKDYVNMPVFEIEKHLKKAG